MEIKLQGTLKSMRDKSLTKYRLVRHNNRLIRAEQELWYAKLLSQGGHTTIRGLFALCALNRVKMGMDITVFRNKPILDYKNIVGGFDHVLLDGWKNAGLIKDDNTGYIDYTIKQRPCEKGQDYVLIDIFKTNLPCSKSMWK